MRAVSSKKSHLVAILKVVAIVVDLAEVFPFLIPIRLPVVFFA